MKEGQYDYSKFVNRCTVYKSKVAIQYLFQNTSSLHFPILHNHFPNMGGNTLRKSLTSWPVAWSRAGPDVPTAPHIASARPHHGQVLHESIPVAKHSPPQSSWISMERDKVEALL